MNRYIVIGAGILGASTAYHLAKLGAEVVVIDQKHQGQATDAAAGMICPWLSQRRNHAWYQLAKKGAAYFSTIIEALEADGEINTGYKKVGAIFLEKDREKLKKMEERASLRREDAKEIGEIIQLTEEETGRLFPPVEKGYASLYISGGARVDGRALCKALLKGAERHGALILEGHAELITEQKRLIGVRINEEVLHANRIIITAGAWADQLLAPLGINLLLTYQKGQIIHLQLPNQETGMWPVVVPKGDQSILSYERGEVVIGATHENHTGFDYRITAGGLHEILDKALAVAPGLANGMVSDVRVGFRPFTPNFLPVIGEIPGYQGLLLANGLGASGLTVGPYLGSQLAKLAIGEPPEIDLNDYNINGAIK